MLKLMVFDLDGTLIDSRRDLALAVSYMRGSMGLEPQNTDIAASFLGGGIRSLVRNAIADAEIDYDEALRRMKLFYSDHLLDSTRLYPGVSDGLKKLHDGGVKLAVLTNKSTGPARKILDSLKVSQYFDDIVGGDEWPLKPAPDALLGLRNKYSFAAADCWMVGDHYTDLEAGRLAGFHRILVRYGFGEAGTEVPDFSVDSFPELIMAIKRF